MPSISHRWLLTNSDSESDGTSAHSGGHNADASSVDEGSKGMVHNVLKHVNHTVTSIHHSLNTTETPKHHHTTTTISTVERVEETIETIEKVTHMPKYGVILTILVIIAIILVVFYCCLAKWWKKFRESDHGQKFKGLDLKSVNLIGQLGKEKVQPDGEALTGAMEENEAEQKKDEAKEEVKLGKLQYKLDYDFNSNNVSFHFGLNMSLD